MSYFMFEKIGKKEEGCFITTLQKTACDLKQLPIQSVTLILKYFQYQGVQRGSGAKATHSCSNNTSDELVYVAHLHGVWVHSSSLLLPIAGDPPPPSLTISTHRYPRLPMETLIKHDCSDATACGRRRRACSLCVCVFARVYCTRVNVRVICVPIYWCVFAYECIFAKRRQKEREVWREGCDNGEESKQWYEIDTDEREKGKKEGNADRTKILQMNKHSQCAIVLSLYSLASTFQASCFHLFQCVIQAWREVHIQYMWRRITLQG